MTMHDGGTHGGTHGGTQTGTNVISHLNLICTKAKA